MYTIDSGTKVWGIICHPKTGSQSTQYALRKVHNAKVVRGQHYYDLDQCARITKSGVLVCFVRNPFDTMVSWYHYMEDRKQYNPGYPAKRIFPEWLKWILWNGNGWIERGLFYGAHLCNRVLRFENGVEPQLNQSLIDCGLAPVTLEWRGKSNRSHYRDYYNDETREAVAQRFHQELKDWRYCY